MDVIDAEQARIAEEAGACAVMALERVPADIRKNGRFVNKKGGGFGLFIITCSREGKINK
jgi:hypothetical protein